MRKIFNFRVLLLMLLLPLYAKSKWNHCNNICLVVVHANGLHVTQKSRSAEQQSYAEKWTLEIFRRLNKFRYWFWSSWNVLQYSIDCIKLKLLSANRSNTVPLAKVMDRGKTLSQLFMAGTARSKPDVNFVNVVESIASQFTIECCNTVCQAVITSQCLI